MGHINDTLRALWTTLRTAFRPTSTVQFPAVVRPRGDRYRVSFALPDDENGELACIGCLTCERICPSQVIKVKPGVKRESPVTGKKRAYTDDFVIDLSACIQCELCVQVCNNDAIVMVREAEQPMFEREDLVLGFARLRKNATDRTRSWGHGTIARAPVAAPEPAKTEPAPEPAKEPAPAAVEPT
ncbi:MAG: 4Fe-4S dicluster domain-containing protein [Deltaproteobacteria bacterium]|nr:4Fe-4S dicluster domain-containing protein [Deltaproteobacteria bacterium]